MTWRWEAALGEGKAPSDDQRRAIEAPMDGRRCIDAGAGTGKTTTLTLRALCLIERGDLFPHELLVVTFTRKAAAEIQQRIYNALQASGLGDLMIDGRGVECSTIHALAASLLREFAYDCGMTELPRAVTDGEARAIFHQAYEAMLRGELPVDASSLPLGELLRAGYDFEGDLAQLALDLKNKGISVAQFERGALAQSDALEAQTWGQLFAISEKTGKRVQENPKPARTAEQRRAEAAVERANVKAVAALLQRFDGELLKAGAMTYGDLIGRATQMLESRKDIASILQRRWKYALIDEFQDTSRTQMRFLNALLGDTPIMPVGDFRQSIYGFNGADPRVMQDFAETAAARYPLTVNRRSFHEIVHSAHHVLRECGQGLIPEGDSGLNAHKGEGGPDIVSFRTFSTPGGVREQTKEEAQHIADEISKILSGGAKLSDIAILLRRRTHAQTYVRALTERGIAVALDRRTGLLEAPEIRDAIAWMSLLVSLNDKFAVARVLQSPVIGLCDGAAAAVRLAGGKEWVRWLLTADIREAFDEDTVSRVLRFRTMLERLLPAVSMPVMQGLRELLHVCPIAASYAHHELAESAQAIVNLRNLEVLAQSFAAEQPLSKMPEFVQWLEDAVTYDDEPPAAELDLDGVRIMTVHQAKGLEWDYVFVACVSDDQYGMAEIGRGYTLRLAQSSALALRAALDGTTPLRWYMTAVPHSADTGRTVEDAQKLEREREQARVFYVAMTRARQRLYVTGLPGRKEGSHCRFVEALHTWAAMHGFAPAAQSKSAYSNGHVPSAAVVQVKPNDVITTRYEQQSLFAPRISFSAISTYQTCPRLARYRYRLKLPVLSAKDGRYVGAAEPASATIDAATFGNLVHRAMELWGQALIDKVPIDGRAAFEVAFSEFADIPTQEYERALATVERAIVALKDYTPIAVEAPFEIDLAGVRIEGFIDLVAVDTQGLAVIIDYKTGRADDEHYALQLGVYKHAYEQMHGQRVEKAAILRLVDGSATLSSIRDVTVSELDRAFQAAGDLSEDTPHVGPWCGTCAYRAAPCRADGIPME